MPDMRIRGQRALDPCDFIAAIVAPVNDAPSYRVAR